MTEPIPASIVKAICKVQAGVKSVAKSEHNQHGKYNFASTDAVYAELAHKMADAGLVVICMEDEPTEIVRHEIDATDRDGNPTGAKKVSQWGRFSFAFVLATEDATWSDKRSRRTLFIQITGPQTFQAAQSYAEKSFLRSLVKLPTGDHDLDAMPQGDTEEEQVALGNGKKPPRKSSAEGKRDGSVKTFNALKEKISTALNPQECRKTWLDSADTLRAMPRGWFDTLCEDFVVTMKEFSIEIDLDEHGWPILEHSEAA